MNLLHEKFKSLLSVKKEYGGKHKTIDEDFFLPSNIGLTPMLKERFASLLTRLQRITQKRRLILQMSSARSNEGSTTVDISGYIVTDFDGTDANPLSETNAWLLPDDYALLFFIDGINDTSSADDGVLNIYNIDVNLS